MSENSNDIRRGVGDDWPITIPVTTNGRSPYDLTGHTAVLYVHDSQAPEEGDPLFSIDADIATPGDGVLEFKPTAGNMGSAIDAFYHVRLERGDGRSLTIKRGVFVVE